MSYDEYPLVSELQPPPTVSNVSTLSLLVDDHRVLSGEEWEWVMLLSRKGLIIVSNTLQNKYLSSQLETLNQLL